MEFIFTLTARSEYHTYRMRRSRLMHSRYQQLELSHETRLELGVSGVGGSPLVEMR